jgi:arsenate reductase
VQTSVRPGKKRVKNARIRNRQQSMRRPCAMSLQSRCRIRQRSQTLTIEMYHNPRCSKSRQTLELLRERGIEPTIIAYLDTPPTAAQLQGVLSKLRMIPAEIMRTGEPLYKDSRAEVVAMNAGQQVDWLTANPKVIERPIVISGDQARIGRPPEAVLEILV